MAGLFADDLRVHGAGVGRRRSFDRQQLHAALRTVAGLVADDLGMHRAGIGDWRIAFRHTHVHLSDEGQHLVGLGVQIWRDSLPLSHHVGVGAENLELLFKRRLRAVLAHLDRGKRIDPLRRVVLKPQLPWLVEQNINHHALRRRENHVLDELLVLDMAAVAAHELHPRPRERNLEHSCVGGVRQVEPDNLAEPRVQGEIGLTAHQQHIAEAAHRRVVRLGAAERRDLPILQQDVVEREKDLAVDRRPIVGIGRLDQHVPVQPHLLAVVLADVRVVPVDAGIRKRDLGREAIADEDRGLRLVRSVVAVLKP